MASLRSQQSSGMARGGCAPARPATATHSRQRARRDSPSREMASEGVHFGSLVVVSRGLGEAPRYRRQAPPKAPRSVAERRRAWRGGAWRRSATLWRRSATLRRRSATVARRWARRWATVCVRRRRGVANRRQARRRPSPKRGGTVAKAPRYRRQSAAVPSPKRRGRGGTAAKAPRDRRGGAEPTVAETPPGSTLQLGPSGSAARVNAAPPRRSPPRCAAAAAAAAAAAKGSRRAGTPNLRGSATRVGARRWAELPREAAAAEPSTSAHYDPVDQDLAPALGAAAPSCSAAGRRCTSCR